MKKRLLAIAASVAMAAVILAGCGKNEGNDATGDLTLAYSLQAQFLSEAPKADSAEAIVKKLEENDGLKDLALMDMEVEPGFLNGFEGEISGFSKGTVFSPMIGTIPFVGYVFESDSPKDLETELKDKGMLNWNICTQADELVTAVSGNFVFFVMAPLSFEE